MNTCEVALRNHLESPLARGHEPMGSFTGAAGGAACGDLLRISLAVDAEDPDGRIHDAGFDARGCGAAVAAGSAVVALVRGAGLLDAARVGVAQVDAELGGLSVAKRHAAELAVDALHRALGAAARTGAALRRPSAPGRVLVAMSGGVDSAVAALLSAREGAEAVGVTLELWSDPENDGDLSCCSAQAVRGAREVAHAQGMAHFSVDLRAEFRAGVVEPWLQGVSDGRTPNPCVRCNGQVRLDAMLDLADRLGAGTLATGHYARVDADGTLLRTAADLAKDQSYVLCALAPESLARLRFPLGEMCKADVRAAAREAGLTVADRRDSQDLCFLAGTRSGAFLDRHAGLGERPGAVLDTRGGPLGEHPGAHRFTVGQRRGLGVASPVPLYVLATDAAANTVTVGPRENLLSTSVHVDAVTLRRRAGTIDGVRVRAHGRRHPCRVVQDLGAGRHDSLAIELAEPTERTAPGQLACLYSDELIVGHGTIAA